MNSLRHVFALVLLGLMASPAVAEQPALGYQQPAPALTRIADAPLTPQVSLSPDQQTMLVIQLQSLPSIAELAEPELKLAGYRIKPANFGPSRSWSATGASLQALGDEAPRAIDGLPDNPRLGNPSWSPAGDFIALTNTTADAIELWVVDVADAQARKITDRPLNMTANLGPQWLADGRSLLVALRLDEEGTPPERPRAPAGPTIQQNLGEVRPARTFQDLLSDAHDEALFRHYFTAQLAVIDLGGEFQDVGEPKILRSFQPSPDGERILVTELVEPFSYSVPASRFPRVVSVFGRDGEMQAEVVRKPLQDQIPLAFGSVETGPRSHGWRADAPATLVWAEAQDGGDAGAEADIRDRVYQQAWPLDGEAEELAALEQRYGGVTWGNEDTALVSSWWWPTRNARVWRIAPGDPSVDPVLLREYSWQDRYNDPGQPVLTTNTAGRAVLKFGADGEHIFMIGDGASEEGDRPFLDRVHLESGEVTRLFRSEAPFYEAPQDVLDDSGERILTRREAPEVPPNFFVRDLAQDRLMQVTEFPHPTPELLGVSKELLRYQRADGVDLTGTLYLPPGYRPEDGPLPTLLWAYPTEFKSADAAGQVQDSPYRFVRVNFWSPLVWLLHGYAVFDDPTMPIIGEGDQEPNDTYVEQLVSSAEAAIDRLVEHGVGDRDRMAIGGHSYGAFMTANLLAHSDLFAAGIARSGAYNRTLTPFGFQAEERTFWESPDVYFAMSPFMHADKIDEPMLMIHGAMDNNSGTFPVQSERMFDAMKALGGTVRLVMLPYESHGYRARESILHMMWEQQQWLDRWVLGKETAAADAAP